MVVRSSRYPVSNTWGLCSIPVDLEELMEILLPQMPRRALQQSYFRTRDGQFIPAAMKLFNAKALAQLLYGAQLGQFPNIVRLETVQSKFLRALLGVPKCVSNAFLRLETGQIRIEARI